MSILRKLVLGWLAVFCLPLMAFGDDNAPFREGTDYQRLPSSVSTSTANKIEVVEFFWYGCSHCYNLEPVIEAWLTHKPENVEFLRIPAVLGRNWEPHARTFYAAQLLGVEDKIHKSLMDAFHVQKRSLSNEAQIADFFAEHGINKETFLKAYNSFDVELQLRRSQQLVQRLGIDGVPTIIVNGKYLTNGTMAGSTARIFEIVDYLVNKESNTG
jgi:thiol:disulfide interchange protein DsbA